MISEQSIFENVEDKGPSNREVKKACNEIIECLESLQEVCRETISIDTNFV